MTGERDPGREDPAAVERLLRERAADHDDAQWLTRDAADRLRGEMRSPGRRAGLRYLVVLVAAAALVAAVSLRLAGGGAGAPAPPVDVAWFDGSGRELDPQLRGSTEDPPVLESVLVELACASERAAEVLVVVLDAQGRPRLVPVEPPSVVPGEPRLVRIPLPAEWGSELDVVVVVFDPLHGDAARESLDDDVPGNLGRVLSELRASGGIVHARRISRASR